MTENWKMISQLFILFSASIIALLGIAHLLITYIGRRIEPRDSSIKASMENAHLVITRQTTMWRAWIGFNASHSMGAILFGCIYGYLSILHSDLLLSSPYLLTVGFVMLLSYLLLARKYWFNIPFAGISLALISYVVGVAIRFV